MPNNSKSYTYRGGERLELFKRSSQFVTRALSNTLISAGFPEGEQISSASTRITCPPDELEGRCHVNWPETMRHTRLSIEALTSSAKSSAEF